MFEKLKEENKHKIDEFKKELDFIKNPVVRNVVEIALCYVHPLFFTVEASSTGKYHPDYGAGKRGLLRHTRAATNIAYLLSIINSFNLSEFEIDIAIASLILHDTCKRGVHFESEHTEHNHPLLLINLVPDGIFLGESEKCWVMIIDTVSSHMGQWVTSEYSPIVLPKPKTNIQKFVHECDYLAAKKIINIDNIWSKEDIEIINEIKTAKKETEQVEPMTDPQKKYIKSLVNEYKDSCNKLTIDIAPAYNKEDFNFLNKKTAGGFIGKLKSLIEKNNSLLAQKNI